LFDNESSNKLTKAQSHRLTIGAQVSVRHLRNAAEKSNFGYQMMGDAFAELAPWMESTPFSQSQLGIVAPIFERSDCTTSG
jgi:hypothetical protein